MTSTRLEDPMVQLKPTDRKGTWMQTFTGRSFYPLDPHADEVDILDVAHGLSHACRYGGHVRRFYSVAEHCVLVAMHVAPELRREALLHDASEAYLGDMVRPLKHTPEMTPYRVAEDLVQRAVFERFGITSTPESHAAIKVVDDRILLDEINELMHTPSAYTERMRQVEPLGVTINGLPPSVAKRVFLDCFFDLFPEHDAVMSRTTRGGR